jgi:formiminoglutamase
VSPIPVGTVQPLAPDVRLPLLLSVPHGGERIPPEVEEICILTPQQVLEDGDEGAREIYDLEEHVAGFVTTDIARAIVDLNRAEDDFSRDGVIKTHTCWDVPVYRSAPPAETTERLIQKYYLPYHQRLRHLAAGEARLGIDCHTMAAHGPPVGPDTGRERPHLCLSDADGTLPQEWFALLADCLETAFGTRPSLNEPFRGGYIIRSHAAELPWVQLEISRAAFMPFGDKRERFLEAIRSFSTLIRN